MGVIFDVVKSLVKMKAIGGIPLRSAIDVIQYLRSQINGPKLNTRCWNGIKESEPISSISGLDANSKPLSNTHPTNVCNDSLIILPMLRLFRPKQNDTKIFEKTSSKPHHVGIHWI